MNRLFTKYIKNKDDKSADKPSGEIEQMEIEYSVAQHQVQRCTYGCTKASTTT